MKQTIKCFAVNTFFNHFLFALYLFNLFFLSKTVTELWLFEVKLQSCHQKPYLVNQVIAICIRKAAKKHDIFRKCGRNDDDPDEKILTYVWVLNKSDGELVQTLSPSNPITLLQMFIFGSNGLFAMTISPLKGNHKTRLFYKKMQKIPYDLRHHLK